MDVESSSSTPRRAANPKHDKLAVLETLRWFEPRKPLRNYMLHETDFYNCPTSASPGCTCAMGGMSGCLRLWPTPPERSGIHSSNLISSSSTDDSLSR